MCNTTATPNSVLSYIKKMWTTNSEDFPHLDSTFNYLLLLLACDYLCVSLTFYLLSIYLFTYCSLPQLSSWWFKSLHQIIYWPASFCLHLDGFHGYKYVSPVSHSLHQASINLSACLGGNSFYPVLIVSDTCWGVHFYLHSVHLPVTI